MTEWQLIETVPKDGTIVMLGWLPNGITVEYVNHAMWDGEYWVPLKQRAHENAHFLDPTHWQPK